ncbi:protein-L-isoaspartate(D-aspartate) O-methyltransferase [Aporhodopirellula aestuarii]|uniref:Protein-L-isoaspartate O-methyltransferase n=1 Tax=Aporhodopirellula aestuarii TaxID=2950107 RepID=A0ABT0UE66_9BACT|nr:protein-L-isoaspartate(D-aspartate) O-methyltransferase [Aporhodopirellula aestuarii]MCM2375024.1 protein-L-isoaspartate(D-aspartate) O-methyltransferase [Aporhodopirellula aestuarii]
MRKNDINADRLAMLRLLKRRGIRDEAVLRAMAHVRREAFLPDELREHAYDDGPLPIGEGQTISQPLIVATMTAALELAGSDRVLEIGTGSGYAAAVLASIADEVYSVERKKELAETAIQNLYREGFDNVHVCVGDGTLGWLQHAPYDAIVVAAGGPEVPPTLLDQLGYGGRLVIPVGKHQHEQKLIRIRKSLDGSCDQESLGSVRFVPLIGDEGW